MSGGDLIDFMALEKELQRSVQSEEKYQRENSAKLRAVSQQVPSFEQFRSLVLASHLKPLERRDKQGSSRKQPWNPVAAGQGHMTNGNNKETTTRGHKPEQDQD